MYNNVVKSTERKDKKVRRARKTFFTHKHQDKKPIHQEKDNTSYTYEQPDFSIDDNDEKEFQLKYFGKVFDEETAPETNENKDTPQTQDEDDDMKVVVKNGDEKYTVTKQELRQAQPVHPKENQKKKHIKKRASILITSLVVIVVFSVLAIFIGAMTDKILLFNNSDYQDYVNPVDSVTGKVNVLLLGVDKEGLRTDTIIVASWDTDDNTLNMLSVPRDTRMYIGKKYQKINAAHAISQKNGKIIGPAGTIEAVTRLTGIPINYYVEFSFKAFRDTIDALDGVYYDVPQNMYYSDPTQDLLINLKKGYQLLDGDKAEQLVRFRSYPRGDIQRVEVQQDFIKTLADQKLNASLVTKLPELYRSLSKNIKTNFSLADVTKFAPALLKLDLETISMYQLPGQYSEGEYNTSYWLCNMKEVKTLVTDVFGYDASDITLGKAGSSPVLTNTVADYERPASSKKDTDDDNDTTDSDKNKDKDNNKDDDKNKDDNKKPSSSTSNNDKDDDKNTITRPGVNKSPNDNEDEPAINITPPEDEPSTGENEEPEEFQRPVVSPDDEDNSSFVRPGIN